jgi:mannitol/fructose-specific phosphotransferase system IIA component (Ntr-type)
VVCPLRVVTVTELCALVLVASAEVVWTAVDDEDVEVVVASLVALAGNPTHTPSTSSTSNTRKLTVRL